MLVLSNRKNSIVCAAILAVAMICAVAVPSAQADELSFRFTNQVSAPVLVKLFSSDRLKEWPDDGSLFILADRSPRKFSIGCELGERICYGAWIEGDFSRYWGAGHEGKRECDNCCEICEIPSKSPLHQVKFQ